MSYILNPMPAPIDAGKLRTLVSVETATIGHFRFLGFANRRIKPLKPGWRVAGTAVTLALIGHDSTLLHHTMGMLRPGDVLVIDRLGDQQISCFGGGVGYAALQKGVEAVVIDGPCNDPGELLDLNLPVWSDGVSPITTRLLNTGGALNVPICCGGAVVNPGDAVLADDNGVVFMRPDEIDESVNRALKLEAMEKSGLPKLSADLNLGDLTGATAAVLGAL